MNENLPFLASKQPFYHTKNAEIALNKHHFLTENGRKSLFFNFRVVVYFHWLGRLGCCVGWCGWGSVVHLNGRL